jgi:hypothetical protein
MVMSLLRLALAIRDADGDTLVNEEVLDQIALPLNTAGGRVLDRAGLLRPRQAPAPPRHPARGRSPADRRRRGRAVLRMAGSARARGEG